MPILMKIDSSYESRNTIVATSVYRQKDTSSGKQDTSSGKQEGSHNKSLTNTCHLLQG